MKLLKKNEEGTHKFQSSVNEFLLSELNAEIKVQEHFVNWHAHALDDITEDVTFSRVDVGDDVVDMFYYVTSFKDRDYHLCIDELGQDEIIVRAAKAEEDGYYQWPDVPESR